MNACRTLVAAIAATALAACASTGGDSEPSPQSAAAAGAANMQLGSAYLQQGNLPIAKQKLERAVRQAPRDPRIHGLLAMLYARLGDDKRAEGEYREALSLAPGDPEQLNNYAVYLCGVGRVDDGVKRFQEAARNRLYSTPWAAYTNAGVCLRGAKRDAEAEPLFLQALQVRPDYAEAAVQLADLRLGNERAAEALAGVTDFMKRNPPTPDLLLLGWRAARAQSDGISAAQMAWRLHTDFPDSEQAHTLAALTAKKQ
ncbi:MAG: type IV pilus biogenesis/stability protein PilW [Proteobacteria bacterium]|nr:type IV pilus biogenesis/stability protein PilW [Pseudomonadota bacterium]